MVLNYINDMKTNDMKNNSILFFCICVNKNL